MPQQDFRARLQPKDYSKSLSILGPAEPSNLLFPLHSTKGILFPYTPRVTTGSQADYDQIPFTHSIYGYNSYIRSTPKPITLEADFTAQTNNEAMYLLAVIHFFKAITKSYFGISPYERAGTPPPVMLFNYLGQYQFNNVPVLIKTVEYTLDKDIDYVPVNTSNAQDYSADIGTDLPREAYDGYSWVPTKLTFNIELETQYIPLKTRNEFNLDEFRSGKLINNGYI